jgi:chromosome partitioning protein
MLWLNIEWTKYRLAVLSRMLLGGTVVAVFALWFWWPWSRDVVLRHEPALKLVGYIVGPLLAIIGYFSARLGEVELREKAEEIGVLTEQAKTAEKRAAEQAKQVVEAESRLKEREEQNQQLAADLKRITEGAEELWKVRPPRPYHNYLTGMRAPKGAKIVTVGNLKGGVGKTTLAANLAAYISETKKRPVLLIDLDFQASLTNMLLLAIEREGTTESITPLLADDANLSSVVMNTVHLTPKLSQGWIVPSGYDLSRRENQMLLEELTQNSANIDVRYRLANALLLPEVREKYDAIILDMPPRMSVAAVNALVASHYLLVPTVLDRQSTEAISQFLTMMKGIKSDLSLDLAVLGIVANMTKANLTIGRNEAGELEIEGATRKERSEIVRIFEAVDASWPGAPVISHSIPRRASVSRVAGEDVAYVQAEASDRNVVHQIFDPVAEAICVRIGL